MMRSAPDPGGSGGVSAPPEASSSLSSRTIVFAGLHCACCFWALLGRPLASVWRLRLEWPMERTATREDPLRPDIVRCKAASTTRTMTDLPLALSGTRVTRASLALRALCSSRAAREWAWTAMA